MSPCLSICIINAQTGYCQGCFRNLEEIANWGSYSDEQRLAVIDALQHRRDDDHDITGGD